MKELTTDQLVEIIDRSLKKTAEDVRLERDGVSLNRFGIPKSEGF